MAVAVRIVFGIIDPGLIEVNHLGGFIGSECFQKALAVGFIAFTIAVGLFLRVKPIRLSTLPIVTSLMGSGHY